MSLIPNNEVTIEKHLYSLKGPTKEQDIFFIVSSNNNEIFPHKINEELPYYFRASILNPMHHLGEQKQPTKVILAPETGYFKDITDMNQLSIYFNCLESKDVRDATAYGRDGGPLELRLDGPLSKYELIERNRRRAGFASTPLGSVYVRGVTATSCKSGHFFPHAVAAVNKDEKILYMIYGGGNNQGKTPLLNQLLVESPEIIPPPTTVVKMIMASKSPRALKAI